MFDGSQFFASVSRPEIGGEVEVLFRKGVDIKIKTIFRLPDIKLVVLI